MVTARGVSHNGPPLPFLVHQKKNLHVIQDLKFRMLAKIQTSLALATTIVVKINRKVA